MTFRTFLYSLLGAVLLAWSMSGFFNQAIPPLLAGLGVLASWFFLDKALRQ